MPKKVVSLKLEPELLAKVDGLTKNRNAWITRAIELRLEDSQTVSTEDQAMEAEKVPEQRPEQADPSKPKEFNRLVMVYQTQGKDPKTARDMAHKKVYNKEGQ